MEPDPVKIKLNELQRAAAELMTAGVAVRVGSLFNAQEPTAVIMLPGVIICDGMLVIDERVSLSL